MISFGRYKWDTGIPHITECRIPNERTCDSGVHWWTHPYACIFFIMTQYMRSIHTSIASFTGTPSMRKGKCQETSTLTTQAETKADECVAPLNVGSWLRQSTDFRSRALYSRKDELGESPTINNNNLKWQQKYQCMSRNGGHPQINGFSIWHLPFAVVLVPSFLDRLIYAYTVCFPDSPRTTLVTAVFGFQTPIIILSIMLVYDKNNKHN